MTPPYVLVHQGVPLPPEMLTRLVDDPAAPLGAIGMALAAYNPAGRDGWGSWSWTTDPAEAMRFDTALDALDCWRHVSPTRPLRPDDRPNRPLTAFTVEVVELAAWAASVTR